MGRTKWALLYPVALEGEVVYQIAYRWNYCYSIVTVYLNSTKKTTLKLLGWKYSNLGLFGKPAQTNLE